MFMTEILQQRDRSTTAGLRIPDATGNPFPPMKTFWLFSLAMLTWLAARLGPSAGEHHDLHLLALQVVCLLAIWLPGLAASTWARHPDDDIEVIGLFVSGCGLAGCALFAAWFASPELGRVASAITLLSCALCVWRRSVPWDTLRTPLSLATVIALMYASIAADHGGMAHANNTVAHRYWVSVDNSIPELFVAALMHGREALQGYLVGDWLSSDRPPLATGMMLILYPFVVTANKSPAAFMLGVALNILWVFGAWAFLVSLNIRKTIIRYVLICVALTGAVFVNTVYTWPKMVAACYVLMGAALIHQSSKLDARRAALGGASIALAMLSHGASIFGILGLSHAGVQILRSRRWRSAFVLVAIAAVLYTPWMAYQKLFAPPGDRLIKWHLAGEIPVSESKPVASIQDAYSALEFTDWLHHKGMNLATMAGVGGHQPVPGAMDGWAGSPSANIRKRSLQALLLAPFVLWLGLPWLRHAALDREHKKTLLWQVGLATASYCLLEFGGNSESATWLHTAPLSLMLALCFLGALGASSRPMVAGVVMTAQLFAFIHLWVVGPAMQGAAPDADLSRWHPMLSFVTMLCAMTLIRWAWPISRSR
jgi:hypothetical protein